MHYEPCCTDCFYQLTRSSYIDKEESYGFGYPLLKLQIESSHFKQPELTANQIKKIHM